MFIAFSSFLLFRWPIIAGDTDIWFHLNYGQYIFEHLSIPSRTFYSFIRPAGEFILHSWLFDVIVYAIHSFSGYQGLVCLRSILYFMLAALVLRYLLESQVDERSTYRVALLFVLISGFLLFRYLLVRPHTWTYLFIVVFLYVLEHRPRWIILLPLVGILWSNIHGVTYPVMLLIGFSYIAEYFLSRLKGREYRQGDARRFLAPLVLSLLTIFLTPHGFRLLGLPFSSMTYESSFTSELMPTGWRQIVSFVVTDMLPTYQTFFNVFLLISLIVAIQALVRKSARVSHLFIFFGGLLLLFRGVRFMNEFALLAMPLLASQPPIFSAADIRQRVCRPIRILVASALMVMPLLLPLKSLAIRPAYPFSARRLPEGVVTFLNRIDAHGNILNHPNSGGYLRWTLYPRYRIFRDMEIFQTETFHLGLHAFRDAEALRKVLLQYHPSFIMVPAGLSGFSDLIRPYPQYVIVFFDDSEVLYINAEHYPLLARQYALADIDPFELMTQETDAVIEDEASRVSLIKQLHRILSVYPGCGAANHIIFATLLEEGAYDRALPYAESIIRYFPEHLKGYFLKADALKGLGLFDEAAVFYRMALSRAEGGDRPEIRKRLGEALLEAGRYREAYRALKGAVDPFSPDTDFEDTYRFGLAASLSGERKVAEAAFIFLLEYKTPPEKNAWAEKLIAALSELGMDMDRIQEAGGLSQFGRSRMNNGL